MDRFLTVCVLWNAASMEELQGEAQHGYLMGVYSHVVFSRDLDADICDTDEGCTTYFQSGIEYILCILYTVVQSISKNTQSLLRGVNHV